MDIPQLCIHSFLDEHLGCFQFLAVLNAAAVAHLCTSVCVDICQENIRENTEKAALRGFVLCSDSLRGCSGSRAAGRWRQKSWDFHRERCQESGRPLPSTFFSHSNARAPVWTCKYS